MPRLRPAPLKTKEEIAKVPLTEPVDLELEDKIEETEIKLEGISGEATKAVSKKAEPKIDEKLVELPEVSDLQKQLESLTKAEKLAREQAIEANQKRQEAERREQESKQETTKALGVAEQAQYDAIVNAIGASQAESDSAQRELETATSESNWKTAAEAQRKLARAEARLVSLEDGKMAYEAKREEAKTVKQEVRPVVSDPLEAHIAQIAVNDGEKDWLRSHKDYLTEPRKNARLGAAHYDAEDVGHRRGSEGYFQFIEERLGLREPVKKVEDEEVEMETRRSPSVAAPVSRETPSVSTGTPSSTRITLTPLEREAAKIAGVDEIEYARQKIMLGQAKREGRYGERH